jgi:hypothetical protein
MPGVIATLPTQQFINNGEPVSGGSVQVYTANTVTPANTWQDKAQTTLNANPIVLNAQGRCNIWLQQGNVYDFVVKDSLGATLYTIEDVSGALDSVTSASVSEWVVTSLTPTFISATGFSLTGNQTATYSVGRRIRATISGGALVYGTIISSSFSSVTTVNVIMDSTSLDSGLSAVDVGIISYTNPSINSVKLLDLSNYSGADISLSVGQSAIYNISSVTSLLLRIATATQQQYEICINPTFIAGVVTAGSTTLSMNNATLGTSWPAWFNQANATANTNSAGTIAGGVLTLTGGGSTPRQIIARCLTNTNGKSFQSTYASSSNTANFVGTIQSACQDTTTAWTSLGTITFVSAASGDVVVRRIY